MKNKMYYYILSKNPKDKQAVGKIMHKHNCIQLARSHLKRAEKDAKKELILVSSIRNKAKNQNMRPDEVLEIL